METINTNQQVPPVQNIETPQSTPLPNPSSHSKILIIVLGIVSVLMLGLGGYVLGIRKNQTVNQQTITTPPTIIQPSPTPTPFALPTADPSITAKRQFDINEKFYPPQNYPPQLINIPDNDLVAMKCTPQYLRQIDGTYAYSYPLIKLDDSSLLQLINEASKTVSNGVIYGFTSCITVDNKIILEYETWSGGGGSQNVVYFGVKKLDGGIEKVATIPAPIFCIKPLQLTRDDVFYYQCGAYENAAFIYRIFISKHSYELLFTCEGIDIGTDNARVVCK